MVVQPQARRHDHDGNQRGNRRGDRDQGALISLGTDHGDREAAIDDGGGRRMTAGIADERLEQYLSHKKRS